MRTETRPHPTLHGIVVGSTTGARFDSPFQLLTCDLIEGRHYSSGKLLELHDDMVTLETGVAMEPGKLYRLSQREGICRAHPVLSTELTPEVLAKCSSPVLD